MLYILFATHYVLDFLLQSREMGKKKSENVGWLAYHIWIQFFGFFFVLVSIGHTENAFQFAFFNAAIHAVIDWNIWRWYKRGVMKRIPLNDRRDFKYWEDGRFYDTIGFDQFLHTATITFLYYTYLG